MSMSSPRVWLITGTSSGLGRELVLSALSRGDNVIATARSVETLKDLQASCPDRCRVLQLDVTDTFDSLSAKANAAVAIWGRVDVLVNNAGYGLMGIVEETGAKGFMDIYKTNVFGVVNVTNAFLPHMRHRRSGTVVIIGSRSGWHGAFPTLSPYNSSKAAVHAIADALAVELRPLGIRVLNIAPGGLRTQAINNCHGISDTPLALPAPGGTAEEVPEYVALRAASQEFFRRANGVENGDPKKAADVIVDVVRCEGLVEGRPSPDTMFLGSDALRGVRAKCQAVLKSLHEWEDVAATIDVNQ